MTRVFVDNRNLAVSVQGHSGYGKAGSDIVCAAISILTYAFEKSVQKDEYNAHCHRDAKTAAFTVECYPVKDARAECAAKLEVLTAGLELLAEEFGEYIRIEHADLRYGF